MDGGCFVSAYYIHIGCPSKLNHELCLLQFILYMKHDNVCMYDVSFMELVKDCNSW
jgi:hypothetical protein